MKGIFITGTDTGVGKTVVTGLLARYILDRGCSVITQKWIQTGSKGFPADIDMHLSLMGKRRKDIKEYAPYVCSYNLRSPSSPHLAAGLERKRIDLKRIKEGYRFLSKRFDFIIVEGVGGALVPYSSKGLVIEVAGELKLPALIVADNRLGAINHTVLTVEALRKRDMDITGVVFNNISKIRDSVILKNNPDIIRALTGENILGVLPHFNDKNKLHKAFEPIGKRIAKELRDG